MKSQDSYTAKEAFTFPLFCLVFLVSFIYWGCADGWHVGTIVGTSFFGILTLAYVFKYSKFGRDYLRIDDNGITYKEWSKTITMKWVEIAKCAVCYRHSYVGGILFYRVLDVTSLSKAKSSKNISVRLSGKYCRNKNVINAIEQFGGSEIYDSQSSHAQNMYFARIILFAIGLFVLFALLSCNNCHDLTENYSVFTYGEGLYGEKETDYPIFAEKLGYSGNPNFIPHIEQSWWDRKYIVLKQSGDIFWIIKPQNRELEAGDVYLGPLTAYQKDSVLTAERIDLNQMKHRKYEK